MKRFSMTASLAEHMQSLPHRFSRTTSSAFSSLFYLPLLILLILATPNLATPSFATAQASIDILNADLYRMPIPIQQQLIAHTHRYVNSIANNVFPNQKQKNVVVRGNEYVARYLVIDTSSATMEALPLEKGSNYKAIITYHEIEYQCRGASKKAALEGEFSHAKTRRLIEVLQYRQGRWR
ncbi:MAG: hypothetical protein R3Y11_03815 [Pseudomonadota bacterium]